MTRNLLKLVLLAAVALGGGYALFRYEHSRSREAKLQQEVEKLQQQKKHLQEFVGRLTSERRVAELIVTEQVKTGDKIDQTSLVFIEYGRDGKRLPPRFFTIKGNVVNIQSQVIKFEQDFLEKNDPLRGHSLVLFMGLYSSFQAPVDAFPIDEPGKAPAYYKDPSSTPGAAAFEADLWKDFWKLAHDEKLRQTKGVRAAHGETPWTYVYPQYVYTVSLQTAGGLTLTNRPIDPLFKEYQEALKRQRQQQG
jgi:hypothetical protein